MFISQIPAGDPDALLFMRTDDEWWKAWFSLWTHLQTLAFICEDIWWHRSSKMTTIEASQIVEKVVRKWLANLSLRHFELVVWCQLHPAVPAAASYVCQVSWHPPWRHGTHSPPILLWMWRKHWGLDTVSIDSADEFGHLRIPWVCLHWQMLGLYLNGGWQGCGDFDFVFSWCERAGVAQQNYKADSLVGPGLWP